MATLRSRDEPVPEAKCPGSSIEWAGCGVTAFAGTSGPTASAAESPPSQGGEKPGTEKPAGVLCPVRGREEAERVLGRMDDSSPEAPLAHALRDFLTHGGQRCVLLDDSRFAASEPGWIGEDGGPGYSSGLYELAQREDVGTLVLTGKASSRMKDSLLWLASRREDLLFIIEGFDQEDSRTAGTALSFPRTNVVALHRGDAPRAESPVKESSSGTVAPVGPGGLAAYLEATDFEEHPPFTSRGAPLVPGVPAGAALRLRAWRRLQGLRRSLDLGTRWVVFELNYPLLWRRVEREVTAFLRRMERAGLLARRGGRAAFRVACGPATGAGDDLDTRRAAEPEEWQVMGAAGGAGVTLRVVARLAEPYGSILESPLDSDGTGKTGVDPSGERLPVEA